MNLRPLESTTVPLGAVSLIEASAGTGKTFTITTLYVRLVLEGVEVRKILVVTYTNAATAELRDRVRRRLREALEALRGAPPADAALAELVASRAATRDRDVRLLVQALRSFDEAAIFTIHGFCQRMLQDHAFESRVAFDAELVAEQELLRDEVVRDFWAREVATAPPWFVEFLTLDKIHFVRLSKLARKVSEDPRLVVVPRDVPVEEPSLGPWRKAASAAAKIWTAEREAVLALLCKPGVLYKNPFQAPRERFAPFLDVELASPRPWISLRFDDLEYLAPAVLKTKTKRGWPTPVHPFFEACGALLREEAALAASLRRRALRLQLDLVEFVRREVRERKEEANVQSFDDLLNRLDDALATEPTLVAKIRDKFPAALIDEFQDTDPTQYSIFRKIYVDGEGVSLFLIGDPKQAIYSFRGADVFTYMSARADAQGGAFTLGMNWRSDPRLVAAVNALFARAPRPFVFDDISFLPVVARDGAKDSLGGAAAGTAPLEILVAPGEEIVRTKADVDLPPAIAAEIARFLQSGATIGDRRVGPGDVAVLCRTNAQAKATHAALSRLGVPAVLYGDASVFDADEAVEVERVLRAMAEPGDQATLRAALVTTLVGLGGEELDRLRDDEGGWDDVVLEFATLSELWRTKGFVAAFRQMLEVYGVEARLLRWVDGERRLTNVLHLGELLQNAAVDEHRGPLDLVEWLGKMRSDRRARGDLGVEAAQIRLESDALRVKVTTVHQAKGLEYPIVYCPFLWTAIFDAPKEGFPFHDPDAGNERRLDIGSPERDEHAALYRKEELAESLRLLYVALTRARHRTSIVWGRFKDGGASALGYLLHRAVETIPGDAQEAMNYVAARIAAQPKFREDLDAVVDAANGAIAVRDLPEFEPIAYSGPPEVAEITAPRAAKRALDDGWRTSSFTRLASASGRISAVAEEGIDHDEADDEEAGVDGRALPEAAIALHDFPRGARAGEVLHEVLETIDFAAPPAAIAEHVAAALAGHGFDAAIWKSRVTDAIGAVLATPLGGAAGSLTIRDVAADRRLSEMEFLFPVAEGRGRLTAQRLAAVLRKHGAPAARAGYAERVARLGFTPLAGFLRGFVDLVFEHDGRWYVVDWKSNFLGAGPSAYAPSRVMAAMETHHYFLQYQLYLVALHRHLGMRLRGYDPRRHLGGVYYLFLRGMAPAHPPGTGIFHDQPPAALVEDLSELLHGAARWS